MPQKLCTFLTTTSKADSVVTQKAMLREGNLSAHRRWVPRDPYRIVLFYRYVEVAEPTLQLAILQERLEEWGLLGRLLIAPEGFNGTLAGAGACLDLFMTHIEAEYGGSIDWKLTDVAGGSEALPFPNLSVRVVSEIISTGAEGKAIIDKQTSFDGSTFGGLAGTGVHLTPAEFNRHLRQNDFAQTSLLLDVRNNFEHSIGAFEGSIPLSTVTYSQTWKGLDKILAARSASSSTPIYMYCTGGIRCEKASAYLKAKGHQTVYQLQGGIHRYLECIPGDESSFVGRNFVFDGRVSVGGNEKEDAEEGGEKSRGRGVCLQCSSPHDAYTGKVCCTVCRQPCLYCPQCVAANPNPGEFHCQIHRHLSNVYFSVLAKFTVFELESQRTELEEMLKLLLLLPPPERIRAKNKRRTLRRQADKIMAELERRRLSNPEEEPSDVDVKPKSLSGWAFWPIEQD